MQLGKYQVVAEIARGGMGIVHVAVRPGPASLDKLLALKQLKSEIAEDASSLARFLEEATLATALDHPNIVRTYEVGSDEGLHFTVMDYLEGVTLARIVRRRRPSFTLGHHLRVIREVLAGLHHAHTLTDESGAPLRIVHRDANPQNVFVTYDAQVKLADFGIAKALDPRAGALEGKTAYLAPEQLRSPRDVDARADVFSVGVMIWEAVAGRRMWQGTSGSDISAKLLEGDLPSIREAAPQAPAEMVRIIEKALANDRDARYAATAELESDLAGYLVSSGQDVALAEVAKVVSDVFAVERETVRATINAQTARIRDGKPSKVPSLRLVRAAVEEKEIQPTAPPSSSPSPPLAAASPVPAAPPSARRAPPPRATPATRAPSRGVKIAVVAGLVAFAVVAAAILLAKNDPAPPPVEKAVPHAE